jgi:hypothetical protein
MPKLINLVTVSIDDLPDFSLPKWLKESQINLLIQGAVSDEDTADEQDEDAKEETHEQ